MSTVGRMGPIFAAMSVDARSRGTPAAARARYRKVNVFFDIRSCLIVARGFSRAAVARCSPEGSLYEVSDYRRDRVAEAGEVTGDDRTRRSIRSMNTAMKHARRWADRRFWPRHLN